MAITLVINNSEDLIRAITKAIIFTGITLFLITCALVSAVFVAIHSSEEFSDVASFMLLTSPFILQGLQLSTTMFILYSAKKNSPRLSMTKCRLWSVTARILAAPILIEMMILIGFKWYLMGIAIPLVIMYFLTMLQVEKIIHYFFTRNLFARTMNPTPDLLAFEYPFNLNLRINQAFHDMNTPRPGIPTISFPPPTYGEAINGNNMNPRHPSPISIGNESPPPPYHEAMKFNSEIKSKSGDLSSEVGDLEK